MPSCGTLAVLVAMNPAAGFTRIPRGTKAPSTPSEFLPERLQNCLRPRHFHRASSQPALFSAAQGKRDPDTPDAPCSGPASALLPPRCVGRILARCNPATFDVHQTNGHLEPHIAPHKPALSSFALKPAQRLVDIRKCARWIPMDGQIAHLTYRKPPVSLLADSGIGLIPLYVPRERAWVKGRSVLRCLVFSGYGPLLGCNSLTLVGPSAHSKEVHCEVTHTVV